MNEYRWMNTSPAYHFCGKLTKNELMNEVPSSYLCRELMRVGFPQSDGRFYWIKDGDNWNIVDISKDESTGCVEYYVKAPTSKELIDELMFDVLSDMRTYKHANEMSINIMYDSDEKRWFVTMKVSMFGRGLCNVRQKGNTLADALANFYIWYVKHKRWNGILESNNNIDYTNTPYIALGAMVMYAKENPGSTCVVVSDRLSIQDLVSECEDVLKFLDVKDYHISSIDRHTINIEFNDSVILFRLPDRRILWLHFDMAYIYNWSSLDKALMDEISSRSKKVIIG